MWIYMVTGYGVSYEGEGWIDYNFHTETFDTKEEALERFNEDYEEWKADLLSGNGFETDIKEEFRYELGNEGSENIWGAIKEV